MRIKSYFSDSVKNAIRAAREELGPDALLLNSREAQGESLHLGQCEVVFGLADKEDMVRGQAPESGTSATPPGCSSSRDLAEELRSLRRQVEEIREVLVSPGRNGGGVSSARPDCTSIQACMARQDMDLELAAFFTEQTAPLSGEAAEGSEEKVLEAIVRKVPTGHNFESGSAPGPVALVGPPGAGKTTSLVKLAVLQGLQAGRRVWLISLGVGRVGHREQLQSFAQILGGEHTALERAQELPRLLAIKRSDTLVMIDTPGFTWTDQAEIAEIARSLEAENQVDVHLVLSASMRSKDLPRQLDLFAPFRPARLLFTKLDETTCIGTILSASLRTSLPLSYFGTGQQIPDDLVPAAWRYLLGLTRGETREKLRSAA